MKFQSLTDLKAALSEFSYVYKNANNDHAARITEAQNQFVQEMASGDESGNPREKQRRARDRADQDYRNRTLEINYSFHSKVSAVEKEIRKKCGENRVPFSPDLSQAIIDLYARSASIFRVSEGEENGLETSVAATIEIIDNLLEQYFPG